MSKYKLSYTGEQINDAIGKALNGDSLKMKYGWSRPTSYIVNDVVLYGRALYHCIKAHTSSAETVPGTTGGKSYWTKWVQTGLDDEYIQGLIEENALTEVDGSLTVSGMAADAKAVGDAITAIEELTNTVLNAVPYTTRNGFIRKDIGTFKANTDSLCTDYIAVNEGDIFVISGFAQYDTCIVATYDADKTFISSYGAPADNTEKIVWSDEEFVVPSGVAYIIVSGYYFARYGLEVYRYEQDTVRDVVSEIVPTLGSEYTEVSGTHTSKKYVAGTNGKTLDYSESKYCVLECDIAEGERYQIVASANFGHSYYAIFDADGNLLRRSESAPSDGTETELVEERVAPTGSAKIAIAYIKSKNIGALYRATRSTQDVSEEVEYTPVGMRYYHDTSGDLGEVVSLEEVASATWVNYIIECSAGEMFRVTGVGGSAPRLWCFTTDEYVIISHADSMASGTFEITAPADGKLIVNTKTTGDDGYGVFKLDWLTTLQKRLENAEKQTGISAGSITTDLLASGAVTTEKILNRAVTEGKIASNAVTTAKIADGAVTAGKVANGVAFALTAPTSDYRFVGGEDLDDYKDPGEYASVTSAITKTLINAPINRPFRLTVYQTTYSTRLAQMAMEFNSHNIYLRYYDYSTGWSKWVRLATTDDISSSGSGADDEFELIDTITFEEETATLELTFDEPLREVIVAILNPSITSNRTVVLIFNGIDKNLFCNNLMSSSYRYIAINAGVSGELLVIEKMGSQFLTVDFTQQYASNVGASHRSIHNSDTLLGTGVRQINSLKLKTLNTLLGTTDTVYVYGVKA